MTPSAVATNQQLAKILERQQSIPTPVLDGLVSRARTLQEWLGQVASDDGVLSFGEIASALARELNLPLVNLKTYEPNPRALEQLPVDTCREHGVFPMNYEQGVLYLAMANPLDETAKQTLRGLVRGDLSVQVAPLQDIQVIVERAYKDFTPRPKENDLPDYSQLTDRRAGVVQSSFGHTPASAFTQMPAMREQESSVTLDELLVMMVENRASDLHLAVGSPPMMRVDGELRSMPFTVLTPNAVSEMLYAVLTDVQVTTFERSWELDLAYSLPGVSRFRVNLLRQRGSIGAVLRTIPVEIPSLDKLKMPAIVRDITDRPRGLVLVTGPTGSGKSTTLAAMIAEINSKKRVHIVTVEDPIEFLHKNNQSVITQREVGADTQSFAIALRHVLRQDPDVILIGEMRDLETISAALTAAETGHLVFGTLHTTSAAQTIDRIIDVFPPHQQEQIRSQLANVLEGIITQTLLPNADGRGRSCAQEILTATPAIRNLIREGKVHQMPSVIQASAKHGMQTLDNALKVLVLAKKVSLEEALKKSSHPEDFKSLLAS